MKMQKAWTITRKEWAEVFKNRLVLFTVVFLPLMMAALPLIILATITTSVGTGGVTSADFPSNINAICGDLNEVDCGQYLIVSEFMLLFMLMPLAIPVTIASYSIVGEKTTRTLEPLLATPISTTELLLGKSIAAVVPAIAATWLSFGIFTLGVRLLTTGPAVVARILDPMWLLAILLVGPLLALAAVSVAVMISSRVSDPRVAEQLSMLVILPLMGVFFGQVMGLFFLNTQLILWTALALLVVDSGLMAFAVHLFQRETILTRWK
jgi:ABC-2 type transport system permease protein